MISFIIPAYNEEALLGRALESVHAAARGSNEPFEVLVVNDASTDRTAEIARASGARVVDVHKRQIGAVRNAGAREARGDVLIFLDADTVLPETTLRDALAALRNGAIGGGARVKFESYPTVWLRFLTYVFIFFYSTVARWAAGCFIFVRRDVFEKIGGFDERFFASEEVHLSRALKKAGRFVVLRAHVVSSNRKARMYGLWQMLCLSWRVCREGGKALQRREGLELWYEGKRETTDVETRRHGDAEKTAE